jgi:hemerythrin
MKIEFINWNESLSVCIKEIDKQHKHFIEIINQAYKAHFEKNKNLMNDTLNDLIEFARIHFSTEENYFKKWDYPFAEEHMEEHEKLLLKVLEFKEKFDSGKCDCDKFLEFLKDWLENHLMTNDKKYFKYFHEKGFI